MEKVVKETIKCLKLGSIELPEYETLLPAKTVTRALEALCMAHNKPVEMVKIPLVRKLSRKNRYYLESSYDLLGEIQVETFPGIICKGATLYREYFDVDHIETVTKDINERFLNGVGYGHFMPDVVLTKSFTSKVTYKKYTFPLAKTKTEDFQTTGPARSHKIKFFDELVSSSGAYFIEFDIDYDQDYRIASLWNQFYPIKILVDAYVCDQTLRSKINKSNSAWSQYSEEAMEIIRSGARVNQKELNT